MVFLLARQTSPQKRGASEIQGPSGAGRRLHPRDPWAVVENVASALTCGLFEPTPRADVGWAKECTTVDLLSPDHGNIAHAPSVVSTTTRG